MIAVYMRKPVVNKTFRIRNSALGGRKFAELSRISYKKLEVMVTTNRTHTFQTQSKTVWKILWPDTHQNKLDRIFREFFFKS